MSEHASGNASLRERTAEEFKAFAFKGNVIDLAVGVIIGVAFGKIVDSLVKQIIMPLISIVLPGQQGYTDPRSRVRIADCTIFGVDNPDHYPPDLQMLVDGVDVVPRAGAAGPVAGAGLDSVGGSATQNSTTVIPKKKIYLREIPIDPITGERDWCVLSSYDPPDEGCAGSPVNVFDVRSKSDQKALDEKEKYSDW